MPLLVRLKSEKKEEGITHHGCGAAGAPSGLRSQFLLPGWEQTMALVLKQTAMASGITVTSNPDPAQLVSLGVSNWPTWGCEVSTFPWTYDEQETCLLLEGDVTVTPDGGKPVRFGAGDLVVFDAGLSCTWDVHAPVQKHYRFG